MSLRSTTLTRSVSSQTSVWAEAMLQFHWSGRWPFRRHFAKGTTRKLSKSNTRHEKRRGAVGSASATSDRRRRRSRGVGAASLRRPAEDFRCGADWPNAVVRCHGAGALSTAQYQFLAIRQRALQTIVRCAFPRVLTTRWAAVNRLPPKKPKWRGRALIFGAQVTTENARISWRP